MIPTLAGSIAAQRVFNDATGGTVTTVSNYNGTGQTWRVHTFTSGGTFTVVKAPYPFSVLVVGGGGGGGNAGSSIGGGGGGGGALTFSTSQALSIGSHAVTRGDGGARAGGDPFLNGGSGGQSSLGSITASGGGGGGGNAGLGGTDPAPAPSGGTSYNITGASVLYGQNGGPGSGNPNNGIPSGTQGGGGGGAVWGSGGPYNTGSSAGQNGVVIVAYRIG
jgi:hypothetical protein